MPDKTLFVCTPLHDGKVHHQYLIGALQSMQQFSGRIRFEAQVGSFLPRNRDVLTSRFLESKASHMLCVDSDIGWSSSDAQALMDADKDFVGGVYCKKQQSREIPAVLLGGREGDLWLADYVPAGFILVSRACIERMYGAYRNLQYSIANFGYVTALWSSLFVDGQSYDGEDVSFCRRWRKLGGEIWLHQGVTLKHYGEMAFVPGEGQVASQAPAGGNVEMRGRVPVHLHQP